MAKPADEIDIPPETLARAEAALAGIAGRYLDWANADLVSLEAAMAGVLADPSPSNDHLARLFQVAHDMKGQAGTFGYPLVTEIAGRLCRLIDSDPRPLADKLEPARALVEALRRVLDARLAGDGGDEGRRILAKLG